jgi:RimJ/RimL family protein N-acetyltransferase
VTNQELILVPMEQSDLPTLQAWFEDEELSRWLGGTLPLQQYFDYVQSEVNYFAWMAIEGDTPVGAAFMQVEPSEPQGFAFLVKPELRSRGYGRLIVQKLMAQPEASAATEWKVGIKVGNIASQRCLDSVGFVPESGVADEEGFLQYVYI